MKNYYLGLDMGTSSVGWATTTEDYELMRLKGMDAWGVRLFEEAQTSGQSGYRANRANRRRLQRSNARIGLLKFYFQNEIEKVDPLFYIRLDNSKYHMEDKDSRIKTKNIFFDDSDYKDEDYFSEYPTIFHLRKELIHNTDKAFDVRLVYLAIANMFKHRGHFLLDSDSDGQDIESVENALRAFYSYVEAELGVQIKCVDAKTVLDIISRKDIGKRAKADGLSETLEIGKNKSVRVFVELLCGSESNNIKLFGHDDSEKVSINFSNYSYMDTIPEMQEKLADEEYELIEQLKVVYDYASISQLLENGKYEFLSDARVAMYEKHKEDLKRLKALYRKDFITAKAYDEMFRSKNPGTYSAYVNFVSTDGIKERRDFSGRDYESLKTSIKRDFKGHEDDEEVKAVLDELNEGTFLPKQLTGANGTIPNQIHRKELKALLKNAESYLPFLKETDESGLSVSERIIALFSFQIPYYIGPTGDNSRNKWAIRKESGVVLPWNIWDKIDKEKTSEEFITTMIRTCTYLNDEKVLPKASMLYEEYSVLNLLNSIKLRGERIEPKDKKRLLNDLFLVPNGKKVSKSKLAKYLIGCGLIDSEDELTGVNDNLDSYLASYGKMYAIFGERLKEDKIRNIAEDIIYYGTVFGDSKEMFKESIAKYVNDGTITEADLKRILGYKFKDWGRISKEMLLLKACDKSTGEEISLIQAMRDYSLNFMELINSDCFTFKEALEKKNVRSYKVLTDFEYEDLDEYYYSAPVKRMVWQTILLTKELVEIAGNEPEKIFVEMTRSDEEKGVRTLSRGKQLLELYSAIKNSDYKKWTDQIEEADKSGALKSKKLYLYYMQLGKDMYTGEDIDLAELFTTKYDIDHIYPRSKVGKDDSILNNLVLVNKRSNADIKKDLYPIPDAISSNPKVRALWELLHSIKTEKGQRLLSDEKYNRLVRRSPLSDEELSKFIARQLVETSQATKSIGSILKQLMPNTTIVYSKAGNVSDFRRNNGFLKSRILNEFHHAKDAYLNIVVGNAYFTKFTQSPRIFIEKEYNRDKNKNHYNLDNSKMFERQIERNGRIAWIPGENGSISVVSKVMDRNTPIISKMTFDSKGAFYNIQPVSHKRAKVENYAPLKSGLAQDIYGGYESISPQYFVFVEFDDAKGKRKKSFESIPGVVAQTIREDADLCKYLELKFGYGNIRIVCNHIKKESLLNYNGYHLYIAGLDSRKNVEFHNATALCLNSELSNYVHTIEKIVSKGMLSSLDKADNQGESVIAVSEAGNVRLFEELIAKYKDSVLKNYPRNIVDSIAKSREMFVALSLSKQVDVLYKVIKITSFEKGSFDLSEIGLPKDVGRIRISVDTKNAKKLAIINQSITGLLRHEVDLLNH